jgi:uncharacterized protein (DUF924 family)
VTPAEVLRFWFGAGDAYGKPRRASFAKDDAFDAEIRARFGSLHDQAGAGRLAAWQAEPASCLALVIVLDQFSRNLYRGSARAFAADPLARAAAEQALARGDDRAMPPVERMFLYLPFEHSESLQDQQRSCELMRTLADVPETADVYPYALRHREIIERFGRFPHRNAALGRESTPEEVAFLKTPGSSF